MIVVIGNPIALGGELGGGVAGTPALAAVAAARSGATVQLVGKAGDDPPGDSVLLALAAAGVGHVAVLRDPSRPTPIAVPTLLLEPDSGPSDRELAAELVADRDRAEVVRVVPETPAERPALEPADVELALRYLTEFRAVVVAEPLPDAVVAVVVEAVGYSGAELVLVVAGSQRVPAPPGALVLEAPDDDPEGAFATMLGELAGAIDRGATSGEAFRSMSDRVGLAPAAE